VLFDEIEKAHADVFNVLLQVLDEGRLTDGHGRTVDFRNTLIILTSNLGSEYLASLPEGASAAQVEPQVMEVVRGHFRPEFLNRLDEIILFDRLGREHMKGIVDIQVDLLGKRLEPRKIALDLDEQAKAWLANKGYDPVYGARPLKRVIQKALEDPLSELLLSGMLKDGETLKVSAGEQARPPRGARLAAIRGSTAQRWHRRPAPKRAGRRTQQGASSRPSFVRWVGH